MANTVDRVQPWQDGTYKATGFSLCESIHVCGNTDHAIGTEIIDQQGEFEQADPEIIEQTGQEVNNVEIKYNDGADMVEQGVVSDDGLKITLKTA